jgi:serine/threonine-protein kinase
LKRDAHASHWDTVRARFLLEARTLQLSHPSLLQVRDFGEDERAVHLVTDLIEGPSLRQAMVEGGAFPWERARPLILQALEAISLLHAKGGFISGVNPDMIRIARRGESDSPERIRDVVGRHQVRAGRPGDDARAELRGQEASVNELPYLAPEVMMGSAPNPRADVFTIGVLAYHIVTGTVPFQARRCRSSSGRCCRPSRRRRHRSPAAAQDAIMKAIEGMPANRFESADAFARALA